jgi:hypothetical protein
LKVYFVSKKSDDEYVSGLDSVWDGINLAYDARDLQNKQYSDILKAEVYEVDVKTMADFAEYKHNVLANHFKTKKKEKKNKK